MSVDPSNIRDPIRILQRIENEHHWTGSEKIRIKAVKTELWFLGTFLRINHDVLQKDIRGFMDDTRAQFHSDYNMMLGGKEPHNFDCNCSNVLAKIQQYKQSTTRTNFSNLEISNASPLSYELVGEFMDIVVQNLKDLLIVRLGEPPALHAESLMYFQVMDQMEVVEKELTALKNFVFFVGKLCTSQLQTRWQTFSRHVEFVATVAAIIFFLYMPNLKDSESVALEFTDLLSDLLRRRIKPIEPGVRNIYADVLRDLRSSSTPPMSSIEPAAGFISTLLHISTELRGLYTFNADQMETLPEQLNTLRIILNELALTYNIQDKMRIHFFRRVEILVIDAGLIVYSLYDSSKSKEDRNQDLFLLADKIQLVKKQIYLDIREGIQPHLPKNDVFGLFVFLLNSLKELLSSHADSLASVKNELDVVHEELQLLQPFLEDVARQRHNKPEELQNLAERVIDKAYEVEYIVDSFVVRDIPHTYLTVWLSEIIWEIKLIKTELTKSSVKNMTIASSSADEELIGFDDVRETIRGQLVRVSPKLDVISIVGMAGTGKTTLALSFNKNDSHFDFWGECRVSQVYTRKDLLLSILSSNCDPTEISKEADDELADRLRKLLLTKRYLLIIDDVWEVKAWDDLILCFPDARNGSRIILTTRLQKVAVY